MKTPKRRRSVDRVPPPRVAPPFSYVGSKSKLADWIIPQFPQHKTYCEVFGGSGSLLFAKEPSRLEIYNDLDSSLANFFRVLREPEQAEELVALLDLTPYSREEHGRLKRNFLDLRSDPVEWARAYYCLIQMSFNSLFANTFSVSPDPSKMRAKLFRRYSDRFPALTQRLRTVAVENRSFEKIIPQFDTRDTLFFCDPPYVRSTRGNDDYYSHEMTDEDHVRFLDLANSIQGKMVISGYHSELYSRQLKGWRVEEKGHGVTLYNRGRKAKRVVEVTWMNY